MYENLRGVVNVDRVTGDKSLVTRTSTTIDNIMIIVPSQQHTVRTVHQFLQQGCFITSSCPVPPRLPV
jgi:hypothetical protein